MSLPIRQKLADGIGLEIFCRCGRNGYLSAEQSLARLSPDMTYAEVAFRLRCSSCGASGGSALTVRFSIGDFYDKCDRDRKEWEARDALLRHREASP